MEIDTLLDENWDRLEIEAGEQFDQLTEVYLGVIDELPPEPDDEDMKHMLNRLEPILSPYNSGQELFRVITALVDDESETWDKRQRRPIPLKGNRLRIPAEERRKRKKLRPAKKHLDAGQN